MNQTINAKTAIIHIAKTMYEVRYGLLTMLVLVIIIGIITKYINKKEK